MQKMRLNIQFFASGTINDTSSPSAGDVRIVWSSTKNEANNKSSVTATVQIKRANSGTTTGTFSGTLVIDGSSYSISKYGSWSTSWVTVGSKTKEVTHNEDGSKSINISTTLTQTGTSMAGTYKASGSATLDKINRASKLNAIDDFKLTDTITINITKYITTFTDKLEIKIGTTLIKTVNPITNGYSLTFTTAEKNAILALMTSPRINMTFILTTLDGATVQGTSTKVVSVSSLDMPILMNYTKKTNGHYQVAINGVVDTTINDVLQVYDDEGNDILNEKVLFTGDSNAVITLSETSANFKYIEVFFRDNDNTYSSVKVYKPNDKFVDLTTLARWSSTFYIKQKRIAISGKKITNGNTTEIQFTTKPNITMKNDANNIYITRVVGYR